MIQFEIASDTLYIYALILFGIFIVFGFLKLLSDFCEMVNSDELPTNFYCIQFNDQSDEDLN